MNLADVLGQRFLLAFEGKHEVSREMLEVFRTIRPAGFTLFRYLNIDDPVQLRQLTTHLQTIALQLDIAPFIIATDQEGGQLMALGNGATPLPGNMALGATRSEELARQAGMVLGREMAAVGVNVDYAPVCDVNINPQNPVIGIRSFGEDPKLVARLSSAMIEGIQSAGIAACAKHFPGHGDTSGDSHHGLPIVTHDLSRLKEVEFPPFQAAIGAGVKMIMTAHVALPAVDGPDAPPATLSRKILNGILREQLKFQGLVVTDAMDMKAIRQGDGLGDSAIRALGAGADLLLMTANHQDQLRIFDGLRIAITIKQLEEQEYSSSIRRIRELKHWIHQQKQPDLDVVGSENHRKIADEIAERSITLVRDRDNMLPLRLASGKRVAVVVPRPIDLTPADTSSYIDPQLANAIRHYHPHVDEFLVPQSPTSEDISAMITALAGYDLVIVGTINAFNTPSQADLVREILKTGIPCLVVALRLPYDLVSFTKVSTYICTYGILEPSMRALAKALFGHIPFQGQLPVTIPGLDG